MIVQVLAHRRTTSRADVGDALAGDVSPVIDLVEYDLAGVSTLDPATGERLLVLDVPIEQRANTRALELVDPGVYPITVEIRRDGHVVANAITFLERIRTDGITRGPLSLAAVASVDEVATLPTDAELEAAHEQLTALADLAERVDVPLTLRIPAQLVDTVLTDDPALAERLRTAVAGDSVMATTDLPLDPSSATAAGIKDEFVRRLRDGEAKLVDAVSGAATQRAAWLYDVAVTPDGAATLSDLGVQMLVMPFRSYDALDGSLRGFTDSMLLQSTVLPNGSSVAIAVIDPVMSLLDPSVEPDVTPAAKAVHMMAEISTARVDLQPDRRSLIVATPDLGIPDPDVLAFLAQFASENPDMQFAPLAAIPGLTNSLFLDGKAVTVELADEPPVDLSQRARAVDAANFRIADVSTMLPAADSRPQQWDEALRTSLTTGIGDPGANALVNGVERDARLDSASVVPPESFSFTVSGREATIPLRVTNTSATPLTVEVHLESDKLTFPANDLVVDLPPNQTTVVPVDIVARSNGVSPMTVVLRTPFGGQLAKPVVLTARVNNLTGLGRVMTVGLLLVLATWWFTYFKRRRRQRHEQRVAESVTRHPATISADAVDQ